MDSMNMKRIIFIASLILVLFVIPFGLSAFLYEVNFSERYKTQKSRRRTLSEFENLRSERYTFVSNRGQELVGYKYFYNRIEDPLGVIILGHGLGGGGHNSYMDIADYFASNGYVVFGFDMTGNDESGGKSVRGLPQGTIDLDYAIRFVKQSPEFTNLPILLLGHSWGAYSVGSVLKYHPDVRAAVMVAGFNRSRDMIEEGGRTLLGNAVSLFLPYISLYERVKFGEYGLNSCYRGFEHSAARVMIIHSKDDEMIAPEKGCSLFQDRYGNDPRFSFILYENRGHSYLLYTDSARAYRDEFNEGLAAYADSLQGELTAELQENYLENNLDRQKLYQLDKGLLSKMLDFYNASI